MQTLLQSDNVKEPPSVGAVTTTVLVALFGAALACPRGLPVTPTALFAVLIVAIFKVCSSRFCRAALLSQLPSFDSFDVL